LNRPAGQSPEQDGIYLSTSVSPSSYAVEAFEVTSHLRREMRLFSTLRGISSCGSKFPVVRIRANSREVVEVHDLCRNKHVCPVCMGIQYRRLTRDLTVLLEDWTQDVGSVYTQTFTLPNRPKRLIYKHEDLSATWSEMTKSIAFTRLKRDFNVTQYLRVTEDVLNGMNSFPHFHLTWFFGTKTESLKMSDFCNRVAQLWVKCAVKSGVRGAQANQQWCGPVAGTAKGYAQYVFKHGYLDLKFDLKSRLQNPSGLKPLDHLRTLVETGEMDLLETWLDYEHATFRRHRIQQSSKFIWTPKLVANEPDYYSKENVT
jgi:hypothetical protein